MADVVFGYVHDFGAGEEWVARRGEGALLDGAPLDPEAPERRSHGKLEMLGFESADPRWVRLSADALADVAYRVRAIGTIAVSLCQVAAARFDGMVTLRGCRAVDVAAAQLVVREAGGLVAFTAFPDPLGAPLDLEPHSPVVAARTAESLRSSRACRASDAAEGPRSPAACHPGGMVDWQLAGKVAEGVAALQPAGDPAPFRALGRARGGERAPRRRLHGPAPGGRRCPRQRPSTGPSGSGRTSTACAACSSRRPRRSQAGWARSAGPVGAAAGAVLGLEAGARLRLPGRPRARAVRVPHPRSRRARAAALRRPEPRARRPHARRRPRRAAALGGAPRDDPRAAVRRRAVAAPAPRRARAGADRGARRGPRPAARRHGRARRPARPARLRAPGRPRRRRDRARAARGARPRAGLHGRARGLCRARHGRRRRGAAARPAAPARGARAPPRTTAPASCACSSA